MGTNKLSKRNLSQAKHKISILKGIYKTNIARYHQQATEIVNMYHNLCVEWEDKNIPDYKKQIKESCIIRWRNYAIKNNKCYPAPKLNYMDELLKQL